MISAYDFNIEALFASEKHRRELAEPTFFV